jgi:cell fate regulator YaaT (PSP1 superfamily)
MPIHPLPQFEADLEADRKADQETYARLKAPKSIVVRFGVLKMVGEFPYDGDVKPGCGSKIVVRTHRGTELGEMLTSTCPNSGCGKSVSRKQMLEYIENSGGRDYPFFTEGRVLRIATHEDLDRMAQLQQRGHEMKMTARRIAESLRLPMKVVDVESILGEERLTVHFNSEERIDFRELVRLLSEEFRNRVDMRQVGARDEARITADYERCGQYCCCKNFLKVLKPISMRSAKIQKATLDPLKISGRCGRLMCCLRYEDATYDELRKRLPRRKQRVGTPEGNGIVVDTQILTQLALIQLENEDRQVAIAVEDLTEPSAAPRPAAIAPPAIRPPAAKPPAGPPQERDRRDRRTADRPKQHPSRRVKLDLPGPPSEAIDLYPSFPPAPPAPPTPSTPSTPAVPPPAHQGPPSGEAGVEPPAPEGAPRRKRRRRRRGRRPPQGEGGQPPNSPPA